MAVDRETKVEKSCGLFAVQVLTAHGYAPSAYRLVEAWPGKETKLDQLPIIAAGFNFDDGGEQGECGSDLRHRLYTIEFYVFARTTAEARNIANVLKFGIEDGNYNGSLPLYDVSQPGSPPPQIDALYVLRAHAARQAFQEPEPWQQHVWTATFVVEDWYNSSAA